jgi:site-specific recombinase XerD
MLYDDAMNAYIRDRRALGRAQGTLRQNRGALRFLSTSLGPGATLEGVTLEDLDAWVATMADLAPGTRRGRIVAVSVFFKWCLRRQLRIDDPTVWLERPRLEVTVPRALHADQVRSCFAACRDLRDELILSLLVMEGLRVSEVSKLEQPDVDLRDNLLLVHGKGRRERIVPLSEDSERLIRRYNSEHPPRAARPLVRQTVPGPNCDERRGLSPETISRMVTRICTDAGVKGCVGDGISAHAFRHTMLSDIYESTQDIRLVQELAGHSSMQTTQGYLRHTSPARMREAVAGRSFR